jgi:hypothetical protein
MYLSQSTDAFRLTLKYSHRIAVSRRPGTAADPQETLGAALDAAYEGSAGSAAGVTTIPSSVSR